MRTQSEVLPALKGPNKATEPGTLYRPEVELPQKHLCSERRDLVPSEPGE